MASGNVYHRVGIARVRTAVGYSNTRDGLAIIVNLLVVARTTTIMMEQQKLHRPKWTHQSVELCDLPFLEREKEDPAEKQFFFCLRFVHVRIFRNIRVLAS